MPQLPESSQPRLTSWVARALLSGYFVAITKQHFFGKPIFKANSPNLPRVGFHFLWRVQRFQRIHLHFISDTLIHYDIWCFSWPFRYCTYMLGFFPAGETVGLSPDPAGWSMAPWMTCQSWVDIGAAIVSQRDPCQRMPIPRTVNTKLGGVPWNLYNPPGNNENGDSWKITIFFPLKDYILQMIGTFHCHVSFGWGEFCIKHWRYCAFMAFFFGGGGLRIPLHKAS